MEDYKTTHCLATIISDLRDDNKALDDMIHAKNNRRNEDSNKIAELQAENERLKNGFGHGVLVELEQVDSLKDEVEELQADYEKQREYIIAVEKENDILKYDVKHKAIKVHQDRIPKEYKAEADEYFSHNPKSKGVRFHMIDFSEYESNTYDESGEFNGTLLADDCIVEIDNS